MLTNNSLLNRRVKDLRTTNKKGKTTIKEAIKIKKRERILERKIPAKKEKNKIIINLNPPKTDPESTPKISPFLPK